jgi:lipoprotein-anchoring transpeptidase ErfK/SrfK
MGRGVLEIYNKATLTMGENIMQMKKKQLVLMALLILTTYLLSSYYTTRAAAEEDEVYIWIHKGNNQLHVMLNDTPVYVFRVATGRVGKSTPEGTFRIVTKVINPFYVPKKIPGGSRDNPLGTRWMGLSYGDGYKYGIHGTYKPNLLGQAVSSGCIRMRNKDVEFLFHHIPLRTRVVITAN